MPQVDILGLRMNNYELLIIRLEEDLLKDLKTIAKNFSLSPESYAIKILTKHIKDKKSEMDKQLKLI